MCHVLKDTLPVFLLQSTYNKSCKFIQAKIVEKHRAYLSTFTKHTILHEHILRAELWDSITELWQITFPNWFTAQWRSCPGLNILFPIKVLLSSFYTKIKTKSIFFHIQFAKGLVLMPNNQNNLTKLCDKLVQCTMDQNPDNFTCSDIKYRYIHADKQTTNSS